MNRFNWLALAALLALPACTAQLDGMADAVCDRPERERIAAREQLSFSGLYVACVQPGSRYDAYMLTRVRP